MQFSYTCSTSQFTQEMLMLKNLNSRTRKHAFTSTINKFLVYTQHNFNFDVYDVSFFPHDLENPFIIKFSLSPIYKNENNAMIEMRKFSKTDTHIFMLNVMVHIGRKIMKANNPELDIFIFDFNKSKNK